MSEKHKFLRLKKFGPAPHLSRQMSTDAVPCPTIRYPLRSVDQWQIRGKEKNQSCSQPMLWTTCKFQCWSGIRTGHLTLTVPTSITTQPLGLATRADEMKSAKLQPSANCACAILLIDGLGYLYAFTRGLPLVAHGESDTGQLRQQIACESRYMPFVVTSEPPRYTEQVDQVAVSPV